MSQTGMGSTAPKGSNPSSSTSPASEAGSAASQAFEGVRSSIDDVKGTVKESANTLMQGLSSAASDAKSHASELASDAKSRVYGIAEQQKNVGADQIGGIAQAVHSAADDLAERAPAVARYVHDAAAGIDRVSDGLKNSSVDDIVENVEHFARTQPLAFFGVAALAGFALSRFVKSSSDRRAVRHAMGEQPAYRPTPRPDASRPSGLGSPAKAQPTTSTSAPALHTAKPVGGSVGTAHGAEPGKGFDPKRI